MAETKASAPAGFAARLRVLARRNLRLIIACAAAIVFVALLEDVLEGELMRLDAAAYALVVEGLRADWLTPVMESFSSLATPVSMVVCILAIAAVAPGRAPGVCCAVNLVLVVALNVALKALIARPRPEGFRLVEETGFSFPSGHSMAAMAFFGLLVWFAWHYVQSRPRRIALCVALGFVIAMIGLSRVYLGVHYASDVVGGFCVSLLWLAFYTRVVAPLFMSPPARD